MTAFVCKKFSAVILSVLLLANTAAFSAQNISMERTTSAVYRSYSSPAAQSQQMSREEKAALLERHFSTGTPVEDISAESTAEQSIGTPPQLPEQSTAATEAIAQSIGTPAPSANFQSVVSQLREDGFSVIQDVYDKNSYIVSKEIDGKQVCYVMQGNTSLSFVDDIKELFAAYTELTRAGFSVEAEGKKNLYYFFSLSRGNRPYTQITYSDWKVTKGDYSKNFHSYFFNHLPSLTVAKFNYEININKNSSTVESMVARLKEAGYKIINKSYSHPEVYTVYKEDPSTHKATYYTFSAYDEQGNITENADFDKIDSLFKSYEELKNAGFDVSCDRSNEPKTDVYSSLDRQIQLGQKWPQFMPRGGAEYDVISDGSWTVSKDNFSTTFKASEFNQKSNLTVENFNRQVNIQTNTPTVENMIFQLRDAGYGVIRDAYQADVFTVYKEDDSSKHRRTYYTFSAFDEHGNISENVNFDTIDGLFKSYEELKNAGYEIDCDRSNEPSAYLYFSLGKGMQIHGRDYDVISTGDWTVTKNEKSVILSSLNSEGKVSVSYESVNAALFEAAKAQLEKDGYTVMQDSYAVRAGYDNGSWIVSKFYEDNFWAGMTVYPFNADGECTLDVQEVESLFNIYDRLRKDGYSIECSDLTSFYAYHSHGMSPYGAAQITSNWTISKDDYSVSLNSAENIQKFSDLLNSLRRYDGYSRTLALDTENNGLSLKVLLSDEFNEFCKQNEMFSDIMQQYNLSISVGRKMYEVLGENIQNLSDEQFNEVLTATLDYYKNVFEIASTIDILSNDIEIYSLHNKDEWKGRQRFSPKGLNIMLEKLNITPSVFDAKELYKISPELHEQLIDDFMSKIANVDTSDNKKSLFVFDGHGATTGFSTGSGFISVDDISNALIQAYNNGANLENIIIYFQSCNSYYSTSSIIDSLKSFGIETFPQFVAAAGKETKLGYSLDNVSMVNSDYAVIKYLDSKSPKELESMSGHLTLAQVANAIMYNSNHTVFITNSQIEALNNQYLTTVSAITKGQTVGERGNPYSELQTENTVETLKNIANFFNLKNPEEFKNTAVGTALGVILETFSFNQTSDTQDSPSFENQHNNLTNESKSVIQKIRELASEAATTVKNTVNAALAKPAEILTEWITHFIYNIAVTSGNAENKNEQNEKENSLSVSGVISALTGNVDTGLKNIFNKVSEMFSTSVSKLTEGITSFIGLFEISYESITSEFDSSESITSAAMSSSNITDKVSDFLGNINTELKNVIMPIINKFIDFLHGINIL